MSLTNMKRERVTSQVVVETPGTPIGTVELERNCSIDIDAFESPKHLKRSAGECEEYTVTFAEGNSPHTTYPFALHDTISLPWEYALKNGVMKLFACNCRGVS